MLLINDNSLGKKNSVNNSVTSIYLYICQRL